MLSRKSMMAAAPKLLLFDPFSDVDGTELQVDAANIWTDSLGKLDISNGKARGKTTATDGNELLTNREFTINTSGWVAHPACTLTQRDFAVSPNIAPTGGTDNYGLEVANTGTGNGSAYQNITVAVPGITYRHTARLYSPSANTQVNAAGISSMGNATLTTVEDTWQTRTRDATANANTIDVRLRCQGSNSGDLAYFDAISSQSLLAIATCDPNQSDCDISVKMTTPASGIVPGGVVVRYTDTANYWLWRIRPGTDGTDFELVEVNAGVQTVRATADIDWVTSTDYNLRFIQKDNIFAAFVNGVQKLSYTDTYNFNLTESLCGLMTAGATGPVWDNWRIYSVGPTSSESLSGVISDIMGDVV